MGSQILNGKGLQAAECRSSRLFEPKIGQSSFYNNQDVLPHLVKDGLSCRSNPRSVGFLYGVMESDNVSQLLVRVMDCLLLCLQRCEYCANKSGRGREEKLRIWLSSIFNPLNF